MDAVGRITDVRLHPWANIHRITHHKNILIKRHNIYRLISYRGRSTNMRKIRM